MRNILVYIAILLVVLWGLGAAVHFAGSVIHFLLVIAVVLVVLHFLRGNRTV